MLASPINPSDLLFVRGIYPSLQPDFPSSVGFEGVGLVDTLGPNVQGLVRGQRVSVINTDNGSNRAEYAVVPAHMLFPVPDDLSDEQVACFFVNPVTAIAMVRHAPQPAQLRKGISSSEQEQDVLFFQVSWQIVNNGWLIGASVGHQQ